MPEKKCPGCKLIKPFDQFNKDRHHSNGLRSLCKECQSKANREYKSRPEVVANGNAYAQKNSYKYKDKRAEWLQCNPTALSAQHAVHYAVRAGKIPRASSLKCAHCNGEAKDYHHHNGYSRGHRLDVIPLCRSCHKRVKD